MVNCSIYLLQLTICLTIYSFIFMPWDEAPQSGSFQFFPEKKLARMIHPTPSLTGWDLRYVLRLQSHKMQQKFKRVGVIRYEACEIKSAHKYFHECTARHNALAASLFSAWSGWQGLKSDFYRIRLFFRK